MSSVSAISLEAIAPLAGFKNKIMNGDMSVWQRGNNFSETNASGINPSSANTYTADRWQVYSNIPTSAGNITYAITRANLPLGTTSKVNEPKYYMSLLIAGVSSGGDPVSVVSGIRQYIEDVRSLGPGKVTCSFWATSSGSGSTSGININLVQNFGTAGSPSTNVTYTNSVTLTNNAWTRYETVFTLANLSGKVLGTDPTGYVGLEFELQNDNSLGSNKPTNFSVTNVQLENDNNATEFEQRHPSVEYQLCQRYYQEVQAEWVGRFAVLNWSWPAVVNFPAIMRNVPLVIKAQDVTAGRYGDPVSTGVGDGGSARGLRGFAAGLTSDVVGLSNKHAEINRTASIPFGSGVHADPGFWNTIYGFDAEYQTSDG